MKIHAIQTGIVLVKTAFLRGSIKAGGIFPFLWQLHRDDPYIELPIYAWVIEHPEGIIVVDTGDVPSDKTTWLIQSRRRIAPEEEIGPQLRRLGIGPKDVSKVVLTHIHGDHVNGVRHFPNTPVYISQTEYAAFYSLGGRLFVQPTVEVPSWFRPLPLTFQPERVGPFAMSYPLTKSGDVLAVPTPGHTVGHMSIIAMDSDVHYFLAGDVTYDEAALLGQDFQGPCMSQPDQVRSLAQTLQYTQEHPTVYLPAHDPASGNRLAARQIVRQSPTAAYESAGR